MSSNGIESGIKIVGSNGTGGYTNISNSIIYDNGDSLQIFVDDDIGHILNIEYSNIENRLDHIAEADSINWGDGNIDVDPRFVNEDEEDYHLLASSLCINAGHPDSTDSDGTRLDMGTYPYLVDHDGSGDWYVSTDGSDETGTGLSDNTFAYIQAALNFANEDQNIHVASGTYYENIEWPILTSGIKLLGEGIDNSIIDGGNLGTVIKIDTWLDEIGGTASQIDTSTHISGFTIQNGGNGWYAGGIYLQWAGPTLTDLDIKDNNGTRGGGIHLSWSWPIIQNVIIRDNQASEYGGGLSSHMTTCGIDRKAILENVIIPGNSAYNNIF
jgi:hypothetical protein